MNQYCLILSMAEVRSSIPLFLVAIKTREENLLIYLDWDHSSESANQALYGAYYL